MQKFFFLPSLLFAFWEAFPSWAPTPCSQSASCIAAPCMFAQGSVVETCASALSIFLLKQSPDEWTVVKKKRNATVCGFMERLCFAGSVLKRILCFYSSLTLQYLSLKLILEEVLWQNKILKTSSWVFAFFLLCYEMLETLFQVLIAVCEIALQTLRSISKGTQSVLEKYSFPQNTFLATLLFWVLPSGVSL